MDVARRLQRIDLQTTFVSRSSGVDAQRTNIRYLLCSFSSIPTSLNHLNRALFTEPKKPCIINSRSAFPFRLNCAAVKLSETEVDDIESLFTRSVGDHRKRSCSRNPNTGASRVSSGIRLENITKSFKGVTVLKDVCWEVKRREKVGLVGINGSGKTTQLRIIAGQVEPDSGNVIREKPNMKIALLSQEFDVCPSRTVTEELLNAFKEEMEILGRLGKVHRALERAVTDVGLMGRLLDELDVLEKRAQAVDLDMVEVKIKKILPELGFSPNDSQRMVASFSTGWQMRMSIGRILLQDPDLILLDEPTNHLDLSSVEWLEDFLKKKDVPMIIISHDRAFLDQLCTKIVETDLGVATTYEGNYSEYVLKKAADIEAQYAAWEKQQKEIKHVKDLRNRVGAGVTSGRASTAEKKLEKHLEEARIAKPFKHKSMKFRFPERGRSGKSVITVKNLTFGYDNEVLFKNASLTITRGEKIAILGPNGCGKSTFLKLIMGYVMPQSGEIALGEHNVLPNYFEQNQAEALDLEKTVLETVVQAADDWRLDDIKGLLGRCNFKANKLDKMVSLLSGGEKARLAFCKFMVKPSTLLVLDEPTNHLDITTKEMLEEALSGYQGTVITVSHDRYFIRQIVSRVIEVKDQTFQDYAGAYEYYIEKNLEARQKELDREAELMENAPKVKAKSKMSKAEREVQKKQKRVSFQLAKAKSKCVKNAKRWN